MGLLHNELWQCGGPPRATLTWVGPTLGWTHTGLDPHWAAPVTETPHYPYASYWSPLMRLFRAAAPHPSGRAKARLNVFLTHLSLLSSEAYINGVQNHNALYYASFME